MVTSTFGGSSIVSCNDRHNWMLYNSAKPSSYDCFWSETAFDFRADDWLFRPESLSSSIFSLGALSSFLPGLVLQNLL